MTTPSSPSPDGAAAPNALRILIADKFEQSGLDGLAGLGFAVTSRPSLSADDLEGAVAELDPAILVVRSTKVVAAAIAAGKSLGLIIRAGAGYNTIDVAAASARSVMVANCPGKNAIAVAELAWSLLLSCDRRVPDQTIDLRAGRWRKKEYGKARGLFGRTLGIVGLGQIGLEIARRGQAFGMNVAAWSRSLTDLRAAKLGVERCETLLDLAGWSDAVAVSIAATDDTAGLIGEEFFAAMPEGSYFVNTSRGSVVDGPALARAVRERGLRAGLDVFADEPAGGEGEFSDPIVQEAGVYGSHHVGASTDQAQQAIADEVVRLAAEYRDSGRVSTCVNLADDTGATHLLTVRHLDRPGVLAHVFQVLDAAGLNVEEMENTIYQGAVGACARIELRQPLEDHRQQAIVDHKDVLSVDLIELPHRE